MRTELKRNEITKLFDLVENPKIVSEGQVKFILSDVKKLYTEK